MKKIIFTLLFITAAFWGCNPEMISVHKNDADNSMTYRLETGYILGRTGSVVLLPCGTINAEKVIKNDSIFYNLVVDAWTNEWLEIESGRSLLFSLDNLVISFDSPEGGGKNKTFINNRWGNCSEKAWYPCTGEDLQKIASAKKVLFRIKGMKRELQGEFEQDGLANFQEFVKLHVK